MNELSPDLEMVAPWCQRRVRCVPGPVTGLWCGPTRAGGLMFSWQRPAGSTPVDTYRLARTRDGREHELLAETADESLVLPPVALNEGWFYRVTAVNSRGEGGARWVYFFLRRRGDSILQRVPVQPGLRVLLSELSPTKEYRRASRPATVLQDQDKDIATSRLHLPRASR